MSAAAPGWSAYRASREACAAVESIAAFFRPVEGRPDEWADSVFEAIPTTTVPYSDLGDLLARKPLLYRRIFDARTTTGKMLWGATLERFMLTMPLYVLSPMMADACIAAANTLTEDDLYGFVMPEHLKVGTLVLPQTVLVKCGLERGAVNAVSWFPGIAEDDLNKNEFTGDWTTHVFTWQSIHSGLFPRREAQIARRRRQGYHIPEWLPSSIDSFGTDPDYRRKIAEEMAVDPRQGDDLLWRAEYERGSVVDDPGFTFTMRFLMAYSLLLDQDRKVDSSTEKVIIEKPKRARTGRKGSSGRSRIVTVSDITARRAPSDPSGEHREVNWQHRWVVSMHKRKQPYGPRSDPKYRIIFVGPYIKGPEDAPIKPRYTSVKAAITPPEK